MSIEDPQAFPQSGYMAGRQIVTGNPGMTLRDWFAGQALAGLMANANMPFSADYAEVEPQQIAGAAFEIANAMLTARSGEQS